MRLFLAINLPVELRHEISAATAALRDCAPGLSWVDAGRFHLTLKFLGEQPEERVGELRAMLARIAGTHREMGLMVGGVGAFPNFRGARVVWMAVEQDPRLELLQHDVEVACEAIGFEVEGRPFRPHITLARVRSPLPDDQARRLARAGRKIDYRGECTVCTIDLMQSGLTTTTSTRAIATADMTDTTSPPDTTYTAYTTLISAALRSD